MFKAQEQGPACNERGIAEFEKYIHAKLPTCYRDFLLKWNGCIPANDCDTFKSPVKLPGGNEVTVEAFYTLSKDESKIPNLHKALDSHVGTVPFDAIPIGHDSFGNLVCLDCQTGLVSWVLMEG
ncbi:MAG: SMI1/KNR4 family protein [Verrucomicrobia bacterium]|nr:SMI1/KNR4 family protein [Verrucomicrobiota bacterium]